MAGCKASSAQTVVVPLAAPAESDQAGETCWVPNTDVYLVEGRLVVKVELSGIRRDDLELSFDGNRLTISGYRADCCRAANAKCQVLKMEINYGAFQSIIEIPSGFDLSKAQAAYQNGFLRIDVPEVHTGAKHVSVPIRMEA
jgi:HSP20 family protein